MRIGRQAFGLLGGTVAFCLAFTLALPAWAGLGDLVEEVVEVAEPVLETTAPVIEGVEPVVEAAAPVLEPVVETAEPVLEPVLTTTDLDDDVGRVVDPVDDVVDPVLEPVDDVVDPAIDPDPVAPRFDDPSRIGEQSVDTTATPLDQGERVTNAPPSPRQNLALERVTELALLRSVIPAATATQALSLSELPTQADLSLGTSSWLDQLGGWLQSALASGLAIPAELLSLLWRALASAGSGLVAPASILTALAIASRRRLIPAAF